MTPLLAARSATPTGPAFTVVLVCHVAVVLVGLVAITASAIEAARVLSSGQRVLAASVRSYFSPGVNWAGRVLYLVPVFGGALIAMSNGADRIGASWVVWGFVLWGAGMGVAEGILWPAERRVQRALAGGDGEDAARGARRACWTLVAASAGVFVLIVAAIVVMVGRP